VAPATTTVTTVRGRAGWARRKLQASREFEEMMKQIVLVATIIVISIGLFVYLFAVIQ